MSVYYPSFNYLGKNSRDTMGLVVTHLDNSDTGEVETFMSMDPVYTDNALGTRRIDYGAKYNSVAVLSITVIKQDGGDFSVHEFRECLKWLTGAQSNSNLDLLIGDEVKYSFTGRFTNASHYKMDARTIGLVLEFTSIAPWAYSPLQVVEQNITTTETFSVNCDTDDLYSYVYMKTTYTNTSGESVVITNETTGDSTEINKLAANEVITLDNNMTIVSDKSERIFGNNFNFVFPRLKAGENKFIIQGSGKIKFEYITPVKIGHVAMDINVYSDPICNEDNIIQVDMLPWSRISEIPNTLREHKISDAYTKSEVDAKISNITDIPTSWNNITHKPTTVSGYGITDVYTKAEINAILSSAEVEIDETELNTMLAEVLV